jgi:signal transduction histidine kinase
MNVALETMKGPGSSIPPARRPELASRRGEVPPRSSRLSETFLVPLVPVALPDERRRVRLLSMIALANIVLDGIGAAQSGIYASAEITAVVVPILLVTAAAYAVSYALARAARTRAASYVAVATQLVVPLVVGASLRPSDIDPRSTACWLALPVLTASAALGPREVFVVGGAALIGMTALMRDLGARSSSVGEAGFFLCTVTVLVLVYLRHRDGVEGDRQELLRSRMRELEELKSTLEQRVAERTEQLQRSSSDLARANDTLSANHALLVQTEKLAAVGRLTAGIAHELASPLSAMMASIDDADALCREYARSIGDPSVTTEDHRAVAKELTDAVTLGRNATQRAVRFVRGIRAHTRDPGPRATERFDLGPIVVEAIELLAHAARAANVRVSFEASRTPIEIVGVPSRVNQVVTNLLKNAIDAIGEHAKRGNVTIRLRQDASDAVLEVQDDGPGIPADVVTRIFEPMFTTKPYGQGTGLGLAIVQEIVQAELKGTVEVRTAEREGATFVVRLPGERHGA